MAWGIDRARDFIDWVAKRASMGTGAKVTYCRQMSEVRVYVTSRFFVSIKVLLRGSSHVSSRHVERAFRTAKLCGAKMVAMVLQKPSATAVSRARELGARVETISSRGIELAKKLFALIRSIILEAIMPLLRSDRAREALATLARKLFDVETSIVFRIRDKRRRAHTYADIRIICTR